MTRPSRELALLETAFIWAQRSTCSRLRVGCVVHREGRILTTGYNGAPAGLPHCSHECTCGERMDNYGYDESGHLIDCPSVTPCTISTHAEENAISYAARWGMTLDGAQITVTHEPCLTCARMIINSGISQVTFVLPYRLHEGIDLLASAGVGVARIVEDEVDAVFLRMVG